MGVLTLSFHGGRLWTPGFQSSTSRHGGTDLWSHTGDKVSFGFNPLHRGMGVLTLPFNSVRKGGE